MFNSKIFLNISLLILSFTHILAKTPVNEEEVKKKLSDILSSSQFREGNARPDFITQLREKIYELIMDLLEKLNIGRRLGGIFGNSAVSSVGVTVLKIAALIVVVGIVIVITYFLVKNIKRSKALKKKGKDDAQFLNTVKDPDILLSKVEEFIQKEDYNNALRFLYLSILIRLNKTNVIRLNKSKTNKQYLNEIRENKENIYDYMLQLTNAFNRHWYGNFILYKDEFYRLYDLYNSIFKKEEQVNGKV